MIKRTLRRRMPQTLMLSLVAASSLLVFATPAQAAGGFPSGAFKLKTTWGGGYVLNMGGGPGSTVAGVEPQIHWNAAWDNANRWETFGSITAYSTTWGQLMNRWSGLCLEVTNVGNGIITQEPCDANERAQYWNLSTGLAKRIDSLIYHDTYPANNFGVTQKSATVGSDVWMDFWPLSPRDRQDWVLVSCMAGGVEQANC